MESRSESDEEEYCYEEQEFGYDDKYIITNYETNISRSSSPQKRSSSPQGYTYEEIYGHSDHEEEELFYQNLSINNYERSNPKNRSPRTRSYSRSPVRYNSKDLSGKKIKQQNPVKTTMSYKDTMKLIDYIFISNYWDKRKGNAILVDSLQISKWIDHFKDTKFDILMTKSLPYNYDLKENMSNIPITICNKYNIIYEILLLGGGKISLCGGSLIELIDHNYNSGDWDLFFHCETVDEADKLLNNCLELIENNKSNGMIDDVSHLKTQRVHTVEYGRTTIQFIKRVYKSKDQVLLGFDLAPSRIGYNPIDGLYTTVCGGLSIAMRQFPLDTTQRSMSFGYRLTKYIDKGFNVSYPGISPSFDSSIMTPDGKLEYRDGKLKFICKRGFESDYESNDSDRGKHLNWFYISSEKYHLITFEGDLNDVTELTDKFVKKSIKANLLFGMNRYHIGTINISTNKLFLGDQYKDFINAYIINGDEKKACQIWKDRCQWYIEKGIEIAQSCKINSWKIENPGSQSFGKFNPILEHPRMWYGDNYQSVEVGIKTPQFKTVVNYLINIIPEDLINLIFDFWLEAEVNLARHYLFSLH
jgi:hypothetical protein